MRARSLTHCYRRTSVCSGEDTKNSCAVFVGRLGNGAMSVGKQYLFLDCIIILATWNEVATIYRKQALDIQNNYKTDLDMWHRNLGAVSVNRVKLYCRKHNQKSYA